MAFDNTPRKAVSVFGFVDIDPDLCETFYNSSMENETIISVSYVVHDRDYEDAEPQELQMLEICKKAESMGIDTLIIV